VPAVENKGITSTQLCHDFGSVAPIEMRKLLFEAGAGFLLQSMAVSCAEETELGM